ncbi:MAG TPA: hypothetical protein VK770_10050 [Candidatus Acidoferrum sp.]|jgi:hypothetical protein|nr:hypothetical protein [Candidatus Acidoferrum sp.]
MRYGFLGSTLALVAFAFAAVLPAQTTKPAGAANNIPNLSGTWNRSMGHTAAGIFDDDPAGVPFLGFTKQEPPLQPTALQIYQANRKGITDARLKGRDDSDPSNSCYPPGPTRIFTGPRPFEIRQTAVEVYILSEMDHWVRRIYMDGRGHPDGYPSTWMGHSIGKYEGNTLVVDTAAINETTWIDSLGHPHSDALHLVERFRRLNHDTLEIEVTFEDPKVYTKSWTGKKVYQLQPSSYEIKEDVICEEYRKPGLRNDGFEFIKP